MRWRYRSQAQIGSGSPFTLHSGFQHSGWLNANKISTTLAVLGEYDALTGVKAPPAHVVAGVADMTCTIAHLVGQSFPLLVGNLEAISLLQLFPEVAPSTLSRVIFNQKTFRVDRG